MSTKDENENSTPMRTYGTLLTELNKVFDCLSHDIMVHTSCLQSKHDVIKINVFLVK